MSKKIISILVTVLMLCTLFAVSSFAAGEVNPGETATVSVTLSGNPGIAYLKIRTSYDASALTLKSANNTGLLSGTYTPGQSISSNPYTSVWSGTNNSTGNGAILTLEFAVNEKAADGTYPITVEVAGANDEALNDVTVSVTAASVTVKHEHKWDAGKVTKTATCKEEGVKELTCTVCGEKKTEAIAKDASNHADYGTEVKGAKAATETAKGYTGDTVCKGCGTVLKKGEEIPALGHKHNLTKTAAKAATCTEAGNVEYYTCSGCKKTFSDAAGTKEITNVTIPAKGHSFGAWKVEKAATKTAEGLQSRTCSVCGKKETKAIPKLTEPTSGIIYDIGVNDNGHDFVGGKDQTTKQAKDNNKSATTEKAASGTKTANNGGKLIKTDAGKDTGDNGILLAVTGLVALAGAAFVVTRKKRS